MNIWEKSISLNELNDGTNDELPKALNYGNLPFVFEKNETYENDVDIPNNIHFIWIGSIIPKKYFDTIINCKKINTNYNVYLWVDDKSINTEIYNSLIDHKLIVNHIYTELNNPEIEMFNNTIINYLNQHENYGYKADVIRLYVVYKYGGIYSDIDSVWIKPLDDNFRYEFVTYRIDKQCSNLTNSFFGFNSNSIILKNAIINLELTVNLFLSLANKNIFKPFIPIISGPGYLTKIIKDTNPTGLNYIHQGYCVIGGPHEELYSNFSRDNKSYCYQTFDKNWC